MNIFRAARTLSVGTALVAASGCAALGTLGTLADVLGGAGGLPGSGGQQGQLTAEVTQVNANQQAIHVRTQDGRSGSLRYDQNTVVVYRQQQYPVTALEPGDVGQFQVQESSGNALYVSRVDVVQSVQERTGQGGSSQLVQIAGQVRQIDHSRGQFELQVQGGGLVLVTLPFNPGTATVDRFNRLRAGHTVSLEGHAVSTGRVELTRFL
jgi:hypothetical protein